MQLFGCLQITWMFVALQLELEVGFILASIMSSLERFVDRCDRLIVNVMICSNFFS